MDETIPEYDHQSSHNLDQQATKLYVNALFVIRNLRNQTTTFTITLLFFFFFIFLFLLLFITFTASASTLVYFHYFFPFQKNADVFCFWTVGFSLFTRNMERKYVFLLCNGILAFLAKTHRFSSDDSSTSDDHVLVVKLFPRDEEEWEDDMEEAVDLVQVKEGETTCVELEAGVDTVGSYQDRVTGNGLELGQAEADEDEGVETESETDHVSGDALLSEDTEGEPAGSVDMTMNEEVMSTEELNRKIEEFIRKMKEEIRIEAQSQLIAV